MYQFCKSCDSSIFLQISDSEPLVLVIDPFTNRQEIHLDIPEVKSISALCCHLNEDLEGFTVPKIIFSLSDIPSKSYFVLMHDKEEFTVYFCLSHQDVQSSLSGSSKGLMLNLMSGQSLDSKKQRPILVCLKGKNLHETIRQVLKRGLSLTGGIGKLLEDKLPPPRWLDGLGWESGIAMGGSVSHEKVVESLTSLVESGYSPSFVLIDEGWQQLEKHNEKDSLPSLVSFEADIHRFPKGIKAVVKDLSLLGIKHVGVWHGMMGSRGGVHKQLGLSYDLPINVDGSYFLGMNLGRTFEFFYDYYGYLREQGIDFIKVGDQSSVRRYCLPETETSMVYKNLQSALQAAASIQFNSAHFNTECLRNENLFYWGNSRIARTAEDIDIINPLGMMQAIHNNLTNSLWLQHLMQPDFDAWLTNTDQSETLAIFHALSGSINVIGDLSGKHNHTLLNKFILPSGFLLKADRPLTICQDSIFSNPIEEKRIYKAFTTKGSHGIVAAFNLTSGKKTLHGSISPRDVEGLSGEVFALFSHYNGFIKLVDKDESVFITLKPNQSDVLTFAPVRQGIAVLGGHSFYLAPGLLLEVHIEDDAIHISSLVATSLLIYCERQVLEVRRNGKVVSWEYESKRHILSIDSRTTIMSENALYTITFEA